MIIRRSRPAWQRLGAGAAAVLAVLAVVLVPRGAAAGVAAPGEVQGELLSVSCPTDSFCMAVGVRSQGGGAGRGLAYRWDGSAWHVMPTAGPPSGYQDIGLQS